MRLARANDSENPVIEVAAPTARTTARPAWLLVLPALACSAFLGIYQLADPAIWIDESYTFEATEWSYERIRREIWFAHFTFAKTVSLALGTSEFALRIPSVIGAVLATALLYGLVKRMFDQRVAVVASLLFAFHPFVVKWSQQARGYSILLALVIAATWLLLRALEKNTRVAWAAYVVALVVTIYWHPFSGMLFFAVHVVAYWRSRSARLAWGSTVLLSFPWLLFVVTRPEIEKPTSWIPPPDLRYVGTLALTVPGAFGVGFALAVVGAILARRHRRLLVGWAVVPFALSLVASVYDPVLQDRYVIVSCPAFAILGAVAIVELAGRVRIAAIASLGVATLVALVLWYSPDGGDNWTGENWREATALVMRDGGARVVPTWALPAYRYYGGRTREGRLVLERRWPDTSFANDPYVIATFGSQLRVLRRPTSPAP